MQHSPMLIEREKTEDYRDTIHRDGNSIERTEDHKNHQHKIPSSDSLRLAHARLLRGASVSRSEQRALMRRTARQSHQTDARATFSLCHQSQTLADRCQGSVKLRWWTTRTDRALSQKRAQKNAHQCGADRQ